MIGCNSQPLLASEHILALEGCKAARLQGYNFYKGFGSTPLLFSLVGKTSVDFFLLSSSSFTFLKELNLPIQVNRLSLCKSK